MDPHVLYQRWRGLTVVVVGDAVLDGWLTGTASGLSREAPAPVIRLDGVSYACGGAANTAANLAALGANAVLVGVSGADEDGRRLRECVRAAGIDDRGITASGRRTVAKRRLVCDEQVLLRYDQGDVEPLVAPAASQLVAALATELAGAPAAVVVCDYGAGTLTHAVRNLLAVRRQQIPLLAVDAHDLAPWRAVDPSLVTPSFAEAQQVLAGTMPAAGDGARRATVVTYREPLLDACRAGIVAVTLDIDGSVVLERGAAPHGTTARPVAHRYAVGAGDAYTAGFVLALAAGAGTVDAANLAQRCASTVTRTPATVVCGIDALRAVTSAERHRSGSAHLAARSAAPGTARG